MTPLLPAARATLVLLTLAACAAPSQALQTDANAQPVNAEAVNAQPATAHVPTNTAMPVAEPPKPQEPASPTAAAAPANASSSPMAASSASTTAALPRTPPAPMQPYTGRDEVEAFAQRVQAALGVDPAWTTLQVGQAKYIPQVAKLMMPAAAGTAKDWSAYRARFVEPKRIAAGTAFWRANEAALERAQARWGVPPWLVVGIVGVETYYGRVTGNFRVIDALATLSFDFPAGRKDRSPFFMTQLEEYLAWCRREGLDPQSVQGSYAGAIGLPQFMPGSINRWAIDFDGDGHVDLQQNTTDVVGSVAHYMAAHGWQRDMPPYYEVLAPADTTARATLLGPDILPSFTATQMQELGAVLRGRQSREHTGPLALVELHNGDKAPSYVAGTENYYVVTRYNWSSYYAMAVIELGRAVEADLRDETNLRREADLRREAELRGEAVALKPRQASTSRSTPASALRPPRPRSAAARRG